MALQPNEEAYIVKLKGSSEVFHEMMPLMVPKMMMCFNSGSSNTVKIPMMNVMIVMKIVGDL